MAWKTTQYSATITPVNASNTELDWSVENITGEATIDSNGLLTPIALGTIKVIATATDGSDVYGELEVTIEPQVILVQEILIEGPDTIILTNEE